ncbi:MAG TPA: hypothetical protein VF587_00245 [Solirubrobacteraceae bacterium]|jgi:hypothetical protein
MTEDLDLQDDCWAPAGGPLLPGDVCAPIPFAAMVEEPSALIYQHDEVPERYTIPVRLAYGLVVSVFEGYAVLAPISPAEVFDDPAEFERLADAARTSSVMVALPRLAVPDGWWHAAVALLFMVETRPVSSVEASRVVGMTQEAREQVAARFAQTFSAEV